MNRAAHIIFLLGCLVGSISSCQQNHLSPSNQALAGTWRYVEYGYSPGAGYYVKKIPPTPSQTLSFTSQGQMSAQGNDLRDFTKASYYRVDSSQLGLQIRLLANSNDTVGVMPDMSLSFVGDTLKLAPPCIEGCHYGFVRTADTTD